MPIDIEQLEAAANDRSAGGTRTNADRIAEFLARNADHAYTRSEIAEATDVQANSVGPTLARLRDRGLVRHQGEYWAITDDTARLRDAAALSTEMCTLNANDSGFD